jgi:hypothetical protein
MKNLFFKTCTILLVLLSACAKTNKVDGLTPNASVSMSDEWWVTLQAGGVDLIGTHIHLSTYNTTNNADSLWVDDLGNGYGMKCTVKRDLKSLTFSTTNSRDEYEDVYGNDDVGISIANGKIIPGGGKSKTGVITDSIYMEAIFTDDPTTTYIISGTGRTRWLADDY